VAWVGWKADLPMPSLIRLSFSFTFA